jgi:hypothetical protein
MKVQQELPGHPALPGQASCQLTVTQEGNHSRLVHTWELKSYQAEVIGILLAMVMSECLLPRQLATYQLALCFQSYQAKAYTDLSATISPKGGGSLHDRSS